MKFSARTFFLAVLIILVILYLKYCREDKPRSPVKEPPSSGYSIQLNGMSLEQLKDAIKDNLGITLEPKHLYVCPCDPSLVNLAHPDIVIDGHGPVRVRTETGGVGQGVTLNISSGKNYLLVTDSDTLSKEVLNSWPPAPKRQSSEIPAQANFSNPFLLTTQEMNPLVTGNLLAIFDSGILHPNLDIENYSNIIGVDNSYRNMLCNPSMSVAYRPDSGIVGINHKHEENSSMIDYSDIWDSTDGLHGTKVTYLAASQRIGDPQSARLNILTMKVLNKDNKGDLFSLMCAMSQARKMGARIFNMSLGYYGPADSLFEAHIAKLADDKIWVVTAAGNAIEEFDSGSDSHLPENRDLDLRPTESKFYPAYFSKNMQHVIAVTSVKGGPDQVCELQNYGKEVVDIGVMADNCYFGFNGVNAKGTSYASPVVAGWLAKRTDLNTIPDKANLLNNALHMDTLSDKIKGGKYIKANGY